ncbi:MAG: ctaC2 [Solirubrobacterales bacterium]|nr:ctaC2 [Solirubrobacterales bacterium]
MCAAHVSGQNIAHDRAALGPSMSTTARVMSGTRHTYDWISGIYLWVAAGVFVLVVLSIAGALLTRRDLSPRVSRLVPVAGPVLLAVIAAALVVVTFHAESEEDARSAAPALIVRVTASQWAWEFDYGGGVHSRPSHDPLVPTALMIPASRPVRFVGSSVDVVHDFWVPDVRFQRQLFPKRTTTWQLVFPHPGEYQGLCAMFCGLFHQNMRFSVHAMTPARFAAWLRSQRPSA